MNIRASQLAALADALTAVLPLSMPADLAQGPDMAMMINVRASIAELSAPSPHLAISGQATGPTGEFLKFIQQSPVRRTTGGMTDNIEAAGNGALRLKIDLPLDDLPETKVAGDFNFSGNTVMLGQLPTIERASGGFSFTDAGFQVHRASGRLFGAPIEITGGTRANGVIELAAYGRNLKIAELPLERPWRDYLGGADSSADVEFKNQVSFYAARCSPTSTSTTAAPVDTSKATPPTSARGYSVQVLAVKSAAQVDDMLTRLKVMGFTARVVRDSAGFFKVRVGPYPTREEAARTQQRLKTRVGGQPFVVEEL